MSAIDTAGERLARSPIADIEKQAVFDPVALTERELVQRLCWGGAWPQADAHRAAAVAGQRESSDVLPRLFQRCGGPYLRPESRSMRSYA
jgi:hypothetical protein